MNKVFVFILSLLILGIALRDLVLYTQFKLDQEVIAATHCINKDKPALQCDGNCYFKQMMKEYYEEDTEEEPIPLTQEDRRTLHLYLISFNTTIVNAVDELKPICYDNALYSTLTITDLFRPPDSELSFLV